MSLPDGVSIGPGRSIFVTQRGYWTRTYGFKSCMFAALAKLLEYAGYRVPLARRKSQMPPENFVLALHRASGAPLNKGSTIRHSRVALRKLLPDAPVLFGAVSDLDLVGLLIDGYMVRIAVNCGRLPNSLKRWVGESYNGGHAVTIEDPQMSEEDGLTVLWMDPMGKPWAPFNYAGQRISIWDFLPAASRTDAGLIRVTFTAKDTAPPEEPPVEPEPVP